jgi:sugar/nucleoside kinase (ribokinase family)
MQNYDIIAIGDIVTDAFIRLTDAEATCDIDHENCKLCVRFGDKVPYESVEVVKAVGNSANAAVSGSRLGLKSALIASVGDDQNGKDCLAELAKNQVATEFMKTSSEFPTNYHYVLWYGVERTILVKHAPFPYSLPDIGSPKWVYLSSMGENSIAYHDEIATYLEAHPEIKLAFQPGTFQMKLGYDKLKRIYARSDIFFCNVEEAERILATKTDTSLSREQNIVKFMHMLHTLGPKIVVVTDGIDGAYAFDGTNAYFMPVYPHEPFERTGAGDAFASTIVAMLAKDKTLEEALRYAPINSMSVVQQVGAQKGLLSMEEMEKFLTSAPADYQIKKLN